MGDEMTWKAYECFLREEELSEGTIQIYIREAKLLMEEMKGLSLTKERLLVYREKMMQNGISDTTLNLHIIAVNRYLKYISREECLLKTRKIQCRRNLENVISVEEYQTLLRYARGTGRWKYYYIIKTMASTGIRVSELVFFTVESVREDRFCVRNKGKSREIYLPRQIQRDLKDYCCYADIREGVIFRGNGTHEITREAVYKMLQRMAEETGIPRQKVHPHSFRHLFAKTYMDHYGNLAELADILGHSSLETTRIYTVSTVEEKRTRMEALGF